MKVTKGKKMKGQRNIETDKKEKVENKKNGKAQGN